MSVRKVLLRPRIGAGSAAGFRVMDTNEKQLAIDSFPTRAGRKKAEKILKNLQNSLELLVNEEGRLAVQRRESGESADHPSEPTILTASLGEYLQYFLNNTTNSQRPPDAAQFFSEMPKTVRKIFDKAQGRRDDNINHKKRWAKIY